MEKTHSKLFQFLDEKRLIGITIPILERKVKSLRAKPLDYLYLANAYIVAHRVNDHMRILNLAWENYPNNYYINRYLGSRYLQGGKVRKALAYLLVCKENTIQEKTRSIKANESALIGQCFVLLGKWTKALKEMDYAEKMASWDVDNLKARCLYYQFTNQPYSFEKNIKKYIKSNSECYPPYAWMAEFLHVFMGKAKESLEWYRKAIYLSENKYDKDFYKAYISTYGLQQEVIENYLKALIDVGDIKIADQIISSIPEKSYLDETQQRDLYIEYCLFTKDLTGAENLNIELIKKGKATSLTFARMAEIQNIQKNYLEAQKYLNLAYSQDSESISMQETLGKIQMGMRKWQEAKKTFEHIIYEIPISPENLESLGQCYLHLHNWEKAERTFIKLLRISPKNVIAQENLIKIRQTKKKIVSE